VSARSHPRLVGAFVLGAIALVAGAIVLFSSAGWLQKRDRFSIYFPGSVRGLNPGAPITFRGIKIGEVAEVKAFLTGKPDPPIQIEVVVDFIGSVVETPPGVRRPFAGLTTAEFARALIERGIRGKLQSQSLLTAQKYVEFDFLPDEPARLSGLNPRYPELPTTPTALEKMGDKFEQFFSKLAELPLDQMLEDVRDAIRSLRELLGAPELRGAFRKADRAMGDLSPTLGEARRTLADARKLLDTVGREVEGTSGSARETLADLRRTLDQAGRSLEQLDRTLGGADEARVSAARTLEELERSLRALRNLVDYVQTHPEAIVIGKERRKEN
jgi:paraquat-inducible protein B